MPLCTVAGCERDTDNRRMCWSHYQRQRRHGGDPLGGGAGAHEPIEQRVLRGLPCDLDPTKCWEWTRARSRGYGTVTLPGGGSRHAHSVMYELRVGPVPAGMELDHLCRNRACVNPAHLEPVTRAENVRRGWPFRADWAGGRRRGTA